MAAESSNLVVAGTHVDQTLGLSVVLDGEGQGGDQAFGIPLVQGDHSLTVLVGAVGQVNFAVLYVVQVVIGNVNVSVDDPQVSVGTVTAITPDKADLVLLTVLVAVFVDDLLQVLVNFVDGVDLSSVHTDVLSHLIAQSSNPGAEVNGGGHVAGGGNVVDLTGGAVGQTCPEVVALVVVHSGAEGLNTDRLVQEVGDVTQQTLLAVLRSLSGVNDAEDDVGQLFLVGNHQVQLLVSLSGVGGEEHELDLNTGQFFHVLGQGVVLVRENGCVGGDTNSDRVVGNDAGQIKVLEVVPGGGYCSSGGFFLCSSGGLGRFVSLRSSGSSCGLCRCASCHADDHDSGQQQCE